MTVNGDYGDNDSTGSTMTISGVVEGSSVSVSAGDDADTFNVTASGTKGLTLDGARATDTYNIAINTLNGAVTIDDSGAAGMDAAIVTGTTGDDAFEISGSQVTLGVKAVNYDSALEQLNIAGSDGEDSFQVAPTTVTLIHIDGGDPSSLPGDTLTYLGPGDVPSAGEISQTGFAKVTYANIENLAPMVDAGGDAALQTNNPLTRSGSFVDPDNGSWNATVDYDYHAGDTPSSLLLTGNDFGLSHTYSTPGTYEVRVEVTDDTGSLVGFDQFTVEVTDAPVSPPKVNGVFVRGTDWADEFIDNGVLDTVSPDDYELGYRIAAESGQLDTLPWTNLNQIIITFTEDVSVQEDDLVLKGVNVATYGFATGGFDYWTADTNGDTELDQFVAVWTLDQEIGPDKLRIDLDGESADAVYSTASQLDLDGEWTDSSSPYPSGDDTEGGDFEFRFNVLPGDVNNDAYVGSDDVTFVRNAQFANPGDARYDDTDPNTGYFISGIRMNVNGSGATGAFPFEILVGDVLKVRNRMFTSLPSGDPAPAPAPAPAADDAATPADSLPTSAADGVASVAAVDVENAAESVQADVLAASQYVASAAESLPQPEAATDLGEDSTVELVMSVPAVSTTVDTVEVAPVVDGSGARAIDLVFSSSQPDTLGDLAKVLEYRVERSGVATALSASSTLSPSAVPEPSDTEETAERVSRSAVDEVLEELAAALDIERVLDGCSRQQSEQSAVDELFAGDELFTEERLAGNDVRLAKNGLSDDQGE